MASSGLDLLEVCAIALRTVPAEGDSQGCYTSEVLVRYDTNLDGTSGHNWK